MKKVYQIVGSFNNSQIPDFLYKEFDARFIYNNCYWFESKLTAKEISEKIKQSITEEEQLNNTWYILELTSAIEGWMGSTHIGWIKDRLDFDNEKEFLESEYIKCMSDYEYFKNNYVKYITEDNHIINNRKCYGKGI